MREQNQASQAEAFGKANAEKIDLIRAKLLQASVVVVDRCAGHTDGNPALAEVLDKARSAQEAKDLWGLFSALRRNAVLFTRIPGMSPVYWEWVDAYGSFSDACGTRWPYMTQEERDRHLAWSEEGVDKVLSLAN